MIPVVEAPEVRLAAGMASRYFRADLLDLTAWNLLAEQEEALVSALADRSPAGPRQRWVAGFTLRMLESALAFGRVTESARDVVWVRSRLAERGPSPLLGVWSLLPELVAAHAPAALAPAVRALKALEAASTLVPPPTEPSTATAFDSSADPLPHLLWPALDAIAQPTWVVDRRGYFQHVNRAWTAFAAANNGESCFPETVLGTSWVDAITGPDRDHWVRIARDILDGASTGHAELIACHSPTAPRFLEVCASPLVLDSRVVAVVWMSYDQTELLREYAAQVYSAQIASRLQGALLAARSAQHHVNNALAVAVGYSELVALDPRTPADLQEMAREALTGLHQAAAYLHQLANESEIRTVPSPGGDLLAPPPAP